MEMQTFIILAQQEVPQGNPLGTLMIFGLLFIGMWFLIIAPQRKRQKAHDRLVESLKSGDNVMTSSGIYGQITNVKDDRVVLKIADNTKIEVNRHFVQTRIGLEDGADKK